MQTNKSSVFSNFILVLSDIFIFIYKNIFFILCIPNLKQTKSNLNYFSFLVVQTKWSVIKNNKIFNLIDILFVFFFSTIYSINNIFLKNNRASVRCNQSHIGFYLNTQNISKNNYVTLFFLFLGGLKFFWQAFKFWVVGILLAYFAIYYLMYIRSLSFAKVSTVYLIATMFSYWLMSGFVFFIKKYQYSKFTSSIQRFWRRTLSYFWLVEFYLIGIFLWMLLNASQEPIFMFDQISIFKTHHFSWKLFLLKIVPVILLILLTYILMISLKWSTFSKNSVLLLSVTLLMLYVFWCEFYQFFHVVNFYGNLNWSFDSDENLWTLELESRKTRTLNTYVSFCLMVKFWHLVFVLAFWLFFIMRSNELRRSRYPLLSANFQNILIIYFFSIIHMVPWIKNFYRRFFDNPYYWFFNSARNIGYKIFFIDLKLVYYGVINSLFGNTKSSNLFFKNFDFFYWIEANYNSGFTQYRKHNIKNIIMSNFIANDIKFINLNNFLIFI